MLSIVGAAAFLIMPVVLGASVTKLQLDESNVGYLASMLMVGSVVSAVSALYWARSINWRVAARTALVIQGTGLVLTTQFDEFAAVAGLFILVSLGGGATYSLALTILSDHVESERLFGYSITGQVAFQVVGLMLLEHFTSPGGFDRLMMGLGAMVGLGLVLTVWLPSRGKTVRALSAVSVFRQGRATSALFGCLFFFLNIGVVWAYIERIGQGAGYEPSQLGTALAIGVSVGMLGALTASWQANRLGRLVPLALATVGTIASIAFLRVDVSLIVFVIAVAVYNFFWNYSLTYQYAVVAAADESGRCVAVAPAFHAAGAAIGPAVAASLVSPGSLFAVNLLAMGGATISLLLFAPAARTTRQVSNP